MKNTTDLSQFFPQIENALDYAFRDRSLLELAFTHSSYVNEHRDFTHHNERLEFLGDSVLNLLVAEYLYRELPDTQEGELSKLRSRLVDAHACSACINQLQIGKYLLLGRGEMRNEGRGRETIYADLFEAIIGAIYLDGGLEAAKNFLHTHFLHSFKTIIQTPHSNWKALLQDYCQKKYQCQPTYVVLEESGPDHHKSFLIAAQILGKEMGLGNGSSKKEAQQSAAQEALKNMGEIP